MQDLQKQIENPVWHIHSGEPPHEDAHLSFNILLNLASVCHTEEKSVLWHFISRYRPNATPETAPILDELVGRAINYYQDFIKPNKKYRRATERELAMLESLRSELERLPLEAIAEDIQTKIYEIGKQYEFENLKDWFGCLYEVLLGQQQGPRMGSFIVLYGIEETKDLLDRVLAGEDLSQMGSSRTLK